MQTELTNLTLVSGKVCSPAITVIASPFIDTIARHTSGLEKTLLGHRGALPINTFIQQLETNVGNMLAIFSLKYLYSVAD